MHRIGRDSLHALNLKDWDVAEGSVAVFAFGEIDVRCHIGKQRDYQNRSLEEIIETLSNNYIHSILKNQAQYNNIQSIIYNVVPPLKNSISRSNYPIYGTDEERVIITKMLNASLRNLCAQHNIGFLDTYNDFACEDGTLRVELSDGDVHINAKYNSPIQQKLHELIQYTQRVSTRYSF
jgi:hypothetical protein